MARGVDRRARAGSRRSKRPDLSERQRPADRAGAGRRRDRHHGAHRGAAATESRGQHGHRRQPPGRQYAIGAQAVARSARGRPHAAGRARTSRSRPTRICSASCPTTVKDFTPDPRALPDHAGAGRPSLGAGAERARADRATRRPSPASLNYGSYGVGTYAHLSMEDFKQRTGTDIVHIPYRGAAPAATGAACRRRFDADPQPQQHRGAREDRESRFWPPPARNARRCGPTCRPSPRPACRASRPPLWFALFGPPNMAPELVAKIHADVTKALDRPQTREFFQDQQLRAGRSFAGAIRQADPERFQALERIDQGSRSEARLRSAP